MNSHGVTLLPHVAFSILFALSLKPRHGYELLGQITEDSASHIVLGAGALYSAIKQLCADNLIEEMPFEGNSRRRYYRLTKKGWERLHSDLDYFKQTVQLAKGRRTTLDDN